jgi:hypothetical protein
MRVSILNRVVVAAGIGAVVLGTILNFQVIVR